MTVQLKLGNVTAKRVYLGNELVYQSDPTGTWVRYNDDETEIIGGDLSQMTVGTNMFRCTKITEFPFDSLPSLINGASLFVYDNDISDRATLKNWSTTLNRMSSARSMFAYQKALESFSAELPLLVTGTTMFSNCVSLSQFNSLGCPSLSVGADMFLNCSLDSTTINMILTSLPTYSSGTHSISFVGNPGASTCDPTIATVKGWTVLV